MGGKSDPSVAPLLMRFQRGCQQVREEFCLIRPPRVQRWVWTFQIDRWVAIWGGKSDLQSGSQSSGDEGGSKSQQKRGCAIFFEVIFKTHAGFAITLSIMHLIGMSWKKTFGKLALVQIMSRVIFVKNFSMHKVRDIWRKHFKNLAWKSSSLSWSISYRSRGHSWLDIILKYTISNYDQSFSIEISKAIRLTQVFWGKLQKRLNIIMNLLQSL